jgi:hypothetical protein
LTLHKRIHTKEGQQRRKVKEERMAKFLESEGITFEREFSVPFSCFETEGKCARVDFVVAREWGSILLEVDENQHSWYAQKCETRRMMDIYSSLIGQGKIVFIRYNPDAFKVDGKKYKIKTLEKHSKLLQIMNEYEPDLDLEIVYLFYDMNADKANIIFDADYALRSNVSLCIF